MIVEKSPVTERPHVSAHNQNAMVMYNDTFKAFFGPRSLGDALSWCYSNGLVSVYVINYKTEASHGK